MRSAQIVPTMRALTNAIAEPAKLLLADAMLLRVARLDAGLLPRFEMRVVGLRV